LLCWKYNAKIISNSFKTTLVDGYLA